MDESVEQLIDLQEAQVEDNSDDSHSDNGNSDVSSICQTVSFYVIPSSSHL